MSITYRACIVYGVPFTRTDTDIPGFESDEYWDIYDRYCQPSSVYEDHLSGFIGDVVFEADTYSAVQQLDFSSVSVSSDEEIAHAYTVLTGHHCDEMPRMYLQLQIC